MSSRHLPAWGPVILSLCTVPWVGPRGQSPSEASAANGAGAAGGTRAAGGVSSAEGGVVGNVAGEEPAARQAATETQAAGSLAAGRCPLLAKTALGAHRRPMPSSAMTSVKSSAQGSLSFE